MNVKIKSVMKNVQWIFSSIFRIFWPSDLRLKINNLKAQLTYQPLLYRMDIAGRGGEEAIN